VTEHPIVGMLGRKGGFAHKFGKPPLGTHRLQRAASRCLLVLRLLRLLAGGDACPGRFRPCL